MQQINRPVDRSDKLQAQYIIANNACGVHGYITLYIIAGHIVSSVRTGRCSKQTM